MTRSNWLWWLILAVVSQVALAEEPKPATADTEKKVYRSVGPSGEVIFSDQPSKGASEVEVTPPASNTYQAVPTPDFTPYTPSRKRNDEAQQAFNYSLFYVSFPAKEETLWVDTGEVTIQLMLEPSLRPGHRLVYMVDGQAIPHNGLSLLQTNVPRGEHKVSVEIHDDTGQVVLATPPVTFFVRRPTVKH
jgi:hypothetical protein